MSTLLRALALTSLVVTSVSAAPGKAKPKSYENFALPQSVRQVPATPIAYSSGRVSIKNVRVQMQEPSVNHQTFVFAREAYIAEKRDEAIKLLRQEIDSGYKRNLDNMLLRLGQLYAEKYMELSYRENEVFSQQLAEYEAKKVSDKNLAAPKLNNDRSQKYLKDALALFTDLEKKYPQHPKMDEIVYFIGFVEMEYGNTEKGKKYLERLIAKYPQSRKFDEAVLYIGDHYFEKHKFKDAISKYKMLAAKRDSALQHYAVYKLAWCSLNTGEPQQGLNSMRRLVSNLKGETEVAKFNLREQALRDLVVFYAEVGTVDDAVNYFSEVQGREKAYDNLKLIADILRTKARDDAAIRAYNKLIEEFPQGLEAPRYHLGLYESYTRLGRTDKAVAALKKAIENYGPTSAWATNADFKKEDVKSRMDELRTETERAAYFFHQAAQKSSVKSSYQAALTLYKVLLATFPDSPEKKKIAYYQAEIYFADGKWLEAANSYMVAAQTAPKDKLADESAYNALLSIDRLTAKNDKIDRVSKEDAAKIDTTPKEIASNEKRFIEVGEYYLKEYPQGIRIVEVKFRMASIYYQYHHYDEAMNLFKEIALKHPKHRSATTAAGLSLDILNIKKDYMALDQLGTQYAKIDGLGDAQFKKDMANLSAEIGFKKIETLEADNQWKQAGDTYYAFYKANPESPLAEKALYNAYVSYQKAADASLERETSRLYAQKYPKSEKTQNILLGLAKSAEKHFDFEEAQKLYADFSTKFPESKEARKALYNAAVFAELTENNKQAQALYEQYLKDRSLSESDKKAIYISQAKIARKLGQWDVFATTYRRLVRDARNTEEKLSYLGEMGRQYERFGKMAERNQLLNEIRNVYESAKGKDVGPAIQYVAESRFRAVSPAREKYEKMALRFPAEDLVFLIKKKQKALLKLAASYDQVVDVGVPDWGVAALYEKAEAFQNFAVAFAKVKVPARYKGEERDAIEAQMKILETQLIKPVEAKVQDILKSCISRASQFFVANEYAVKCRERIASNGVVVEPSGLLPQPSYWTSRFPSEGVARK